MKGKMDIDNGEIRVRSVDGAVSGRLFVPKGGRRRPLLVCIHGGGSNGQYFELKGRSVPVMAAERDLPVLLVDRPGYRGNPAPVGSDPISGSVSTIRRFIDEVRVTQGIDSGGLIMIGHSIGGAIALRMAANRGAWPLLGIAVSGIGDVSPEEVRAMPSPLEATTFVPPPAFAEMLFYDPDRTLDWRALASLRMATEPWLTREIVEIVGEWPVQWPSIARMIDVPVHLRLAEHDRIWQTGASVVKRMGAAMEQAPRVDGDLLRDGGHLYEAHRNGKQLITSQLDFLLDCAECAEGRTQ